MESKSGVYVRAKSPSGKWWAAPAEVLTEESFRVFVLDIMANMNALVRIQRAYSMPLETECEPDNDD